MHITPDSPVGSIATAYPLSTRVFARHQIDFCCGGGKPLAVAAADRGLAPATLLAELQAELSAAPSAGVQWDEQPLELLIQHILDTYHVPLKAELPRLEAMAAKVLAVHGDKDPERLEALCDNVYALADELRQHMLKEERVLFPAILADRVVTGPVSVMEAEHDSVGRVLRELRLLTDDYQPPAAACTTWRALWAGLADLEVQLHEHIHLENNVLHKRART